jgi:DNA (cytosine-5)-methyltransferase 1
MAVDTDGYALATFHRNLPWMFSPGLREPRIVQEPVEAIASGAWGESLTPAERRLQRDVGSIDILLGGPPCQGHSNLNNYTRRKDDRNVLFLRMARFAEVLRPGVIIIENVVGVIHDSRQVYQRTWAFLEQLGYSVDGGIVKANHIGVPQRRARVVLVARRTGDVVLRDILGRFATPDRPAMWALDHLVDAPNSSAFDTPAVPAAETERRIRYLFERGMHLLPDSERPDCHRTRVHKYQSVYGRMFEDQPAPTITTGFMTMGRGRFVHPTRPRTLTPHEGALLQFFPDSFRFGALSRKSYANLIGNAVPPKLAYVLALGLLT